MKRKIKMLRLARGRWSGIAAGCNITPGKAMLSTNATNLAHPRRRKRFSLLDHPLIATPPPSAEEAVDNILYNTPPQGPSPVTRHILNCLVTNEPGVLSRVSGILAGRGFNIDSLVVAKTEVPDLSRMTVVLKGSSNIIEQCRRQLEDLVPVWAVLDYTWSKVVERELLLVKVSGMPLDYTGTATASSSSAATALASSSSSAASRRQESMEEDSVEVEGFEVVEPSTTISPLLAAGIHRDAITQLAKLFRARVVDITYDDMVIELCSRPDKVDAFLKLLKPYGIVEMTRSGSITLARSPLDDLNTEEVVEAEEGGVDASQLPPG